MTCCWWCCSVISHVWLFVNPWTAAHLTSLSFTISWSLLKLMSIEPMLPSNHLILCHPLLLLPSIFLSIRVFSNEENLFPSGGQSTGASAAGSVLPIYIQDWFPLGLADLISCCPRDSQEYSPALQFKIINSLLLSLPYCPTLTSKCDYWKNHSFDSIDLCQQSDVSAF